MLLEFWLLPGQGLPAGTVGCDGEEPRNGGRPARPRASGYDEPVFTPPTVWLPPQRVVTMAVSFVHGNMVPCPPDGHCDAFVTFRTREFRCRWRMMG